MKKILFICATMFLLIGMTSCEKDNIWGDGPSDMEHIYFVGFYKTNVNTDALNYEIAADGTARWRINTVATWTNTGEVNITSLIPLQLSSERIRSYDAQTYFWVTNNGTSTLKAGTDFIVLNESGSEIAANSGVYSLTWAQTKKGIQNVKIKRLTSAKGSLKVNVLDPAKGTPNASDLTTLVNNKTNEYEMRGLSFDYNKVTVTFN